MTHEFKHPKYWKELRKIRAASFKQQASSTKHQAPSANELDRDPPVGYSRTDDVTAIHGGHSSARSVQPKATSNTGDAPHMGPRNSAAETLHLEQHKYPGDGSSRMVQGYGPSQSSNKPEPEPSSGPGSQTPQATSSKHRDPL